eukprot:COSAG01_NODE_38165_length_493_cov_1.223350_2_plen_22_part_01
MASKWRARRIIKAPITFGRAFS